MTTNLDCAQYAAELARVHAAYAMDKASLTVIQTNLAEIQRINHARQQAYALHGWILGFTLLAVTVHFFIHRLKYRMLRDENKKLHNVLSLIRTTHEDPDCPACRAVEEALK